MRILHISDMHYGINNDKNYEDTIKTNRDSAMGKMLSKIKDIQKQSPIEYILVTGDIAYTASKEEYIKAEKFFLELTKVTNLSVNKIFVCPGNHDVDRKELEDKEFPEHQAKANQFLRFENLDRLSIRFKNYIDFCKNIGLPKYKINDIDSYIIGVNSEANINIVCINTAWFAKNNDVNNKMWIGNNFIEMIEQNGYLSKDKLTITIMHHPNRSLNEEETNNYYGLINVYDKICDFSDMILFGHTHEIKNDPIYAHGTYVCGTGASYISKTYGHSFHVYDIDKDEQKKTAYIFLNNKWVEYSNDNFEHSLKFFNKNKGESKTHINKNKNMSKKKSQNIKKISKTKLIKDIERKIEEEISIKYLDPVVKNVMHESEKMRLLEQTMLNFLDETESWDDIINTIITSQYCQVKFLLEGYEGTGKSTILSLLYLKLKQKYNEKKIKFYPIYIDLHKFEMFELDESKKIIQKELRLVDDIINYEKILFIIDGCDDFFSPTDKLQKDLLLYIRKNGSRVILCIGNENTISESEYEAISPFRELANQNSFKLKCNSIPINSNELLRTLESLDIIINNNKNINKYTKLLKIMKKTSLKQIDFRTICICLKNYDNRDQNFTTILRKYFRALNGRQESEYKTATMCFSYILGKNVDDIFNGKNSMIFKGSLYKSFLIAYYFVYTILNKDIHAQEYMDLGNIEYIFTPVINNFIKNLINGMKEKKKNEMVKNMISLYKGKSHLSIKSQLCYLIGRIKINDASCQEEIKKFLLEESKAVESEIYLSNGNNIKTDELYRILYRSISISLVMLGINDELDNFIEHLLYDIKLNDISRGFHIRYYSRESYFFGINPQYHDDLDAKVDDILDYSIDTIKRRLNKDYNNYPLLYIEIITIYSIFISRLNNVELYNKYKQIFIEISDKISISIENLIIKNYVESMKEVIEVGDPFKSYIDEIYNLKRNKRQGWINRGIQNGESIADHILLSYRLAVVLLPDSYDEIKTYYKVSDISNYKEYDKNEILQMILIHDNGEAYYGDKVKPTEDDKRNESNRFIYYSFLSTLPQFHGTNIEEMYWNKFNENNINANIANDIDKIEALIQAKFYSMDYTVNVDEWKKDVIKNLKSSLGSIIYRSILYEIIEK